MSAVWICIIINHHSCYCEWGVLHGLFCYIHWLPIRHPSFSDTGKPFKKTIFKHIYFKVMRTMYKYHLSLGGKKYLLRSPFWQIVYEIQSFYIMLKTLFHLPPWEGLLKVYVSVGGISVLCTNDLMPLIICKNYKHIVTLYEVIFSNMTGILSHLSYIFYQHKTAAMCHWNVMYWETYLSTILIRRSLFLRAKMK